MHEARNTNQRQEGIATYGTEAAQAVGFPGSSLVYVFTNTFYFEGGSKPSFFEKVRVRKCPYCGAWAVHAAQRELQNVETESTVTEGVPWPTADGVLGTKTPGMDKPVAPAAVAVATLDFQESFQCNHCGKMWTRTVKHEERADEAFGEFNVEVQREGFEG
jgi:hypothetical protein